jgi:integrase/recombinase XerC
MRREECAGIALDDLELDQKIVWVLGNGSRPRALPLGRRTAVALDRYLRVRDGHCLAHLPDLWLGQRAGSHRRGVPGCA